MTLIAEDLLLLLLDDEKGTLDASSSVTTVLGGAVLAELALSGAATVEEKPGLWRSTRVRPAPADLDDRVLTAALATIAEKERSAQDLVTRLGKGLKDELADRLVDRGILQRRETRLLGLFPRTRWPAANRTHEEEVRRALTASLVQGADPDPRTATLVALLVAINHAHKVVDHEGMSARDVKKRAKQISEGSWAAKAVKDAIAATTHAVNAAVVAAAAGGAAGSS